MNGTVTIRRRIEEYMIAAGKVILVLCLLDLLLAYLEVFPPITQPLQISTVLLLVVSVNIVTGVLLYSKQMPGRHSAGSDGLPTDESRLMNGAVLALLSVIIVLFTCTAFYGACLLFDYEPLSPPIVILSSLSVVLFLMAAWAPYCRTPKGSLKVARASFALAIVSLVLQAIADSCSISLFESPFVKMPISPGCLTCIVSLFLSAVSLLVVELHGNEHDR